MSSFLYLDINSYSYKYSTDFHVQYVYFDYFFVRNINKEIISCENVNLKKLIPWLQLDVHLAAFDYVTTGKNKDSPL